MNIVIFASGNGTNAQQIIEYFSENPEINISLILSNKADAYVLERAAKFGIPSFVFSAYELKDTTIVDQKLKEFKIDFIVLAGFLLMMPSRLIHKFPDKIINIHPALLPLYGGKGMYGDHVHKAVIAAGESESGISIHYVNEHYDDGKIIFQARCPVLKTDTPEDLAKRIHQLEYSYFPAVIEKVILGKTK